MGALAYAIQLLGLVPSITTMTTEIRGLFTSGRDALAKMEAEKRDPTPEEWDALNKTIDALRSQLHKSYP